MTKSRQTKLADCVELLSGFAFKSQQFTDDHNDVALVKGENVSQGHVLWDISKRWPRSDWEKFEKFQLAVGDIIIAMDRPWVPAGLKWCFIREHDPKSLLVQRCCRLRAKPSLMDQTFLRCVIGSPGFESYIKPITTGVNIPHISGKQILDYAFNLPDLPTQRKIAGILSAYDDLIENNLRRIKILEEMAQSLYREWFVHFRFPRDPSEASAKAGGHESAKFVDSALGQIPKGWEVVPMGDFVQFKSGFAFKSSKFTDDGEHRLVTIKNVQDGVFNPVSDSLLDKLPEKLPSYCILGDGDILLSLTGNVGRVCLVYAGPFLLNQRVAKLSPVSSFDWMLAYCVFRSSEMRTALEMLSNGVAQQNLSPVQTSKMDFARPPGILRERYASIAEPIGLHIVQLYNANQNLRRTRDLLLPKLLSSQF
jgi:type I restriction enzyme, S subunit